MDLDWMYDGMKIQKEDYLLGKKVDKKFNENSDNDSILPPQICPTNTNFSQVDMTKKILEDPLVNIKKQEIECTQKFLRNPVLLKKQQKIKKENHIIEDHQLDIILVSRLKSFSKAGIDLEKILSMTKRVGKKEHKSKHKIDKSSSEENEKNDYHKKPNNKQKQHIQNLERKSHSQNDKKSHEYKDYRRNEYKNKSERDKSVLSSDDSNFSKRNKSYQEFKHQRDDDQKYKDNQSKIKHKSIITDKEENHHSYTKNINEHKLEENHKYQNDKNLKNKYRNSHYIVGNNNKKYSSSSVTKDEKSKYKHQEDKNRNKYYNDNKNYESGSLDRESEKKKKKEIELKINTTEQSVRKFKNNEYHNRSDSFNREHESKDFMDPRNSHGYRKHLNTRRSRSVSPSKKKKYQDTHEIKKERPRRMSNSSSSSQSDNERKNNKTVKRQTLKHEHSPKCQSENEKHIQHVKDDKNGKAYGLFVPKSHSMKKQSLSPPCTKIKKNTANVRSKSPPIKKKKLTEEEMERMRKEMMEDAKTRDKERSSNVKRYRKNDKKEEEKQKPYSKEFLIKQLANVASQVSVERSIKSNLNNLQKI